MTDLMTMSGYAAFVWGAYGLCVLILLGLLVLSLMRLKERTEQVRRLQQVRDNKGQWPGRQAAGSSEPYASGAKTDAT